MCPEQFKMRLILKLRIYVLVEYKIVLIKIAQLNKNFFPKNLLAYIDMCAYITCVKLGDILKLYFVF